MQANVPIGFRAPGFILEPTGIDRFLLGSDLIRPCIRSEMTGFGSRKLRPGNVLKRVEYLKRVLFR